MGMWTKEQLRAFIQREQVGDGGRCPKCLERDENESAKFWLGVLNDLNNRGVQDILILCVDNLNGFSHQLLRAIPKQKSRNASSTKFAIPPGTSPTKTSRRSLLICSSRNRKRRHGRISNRKSRAKHGSP